MPNSLTNGEKNVFVMTMVSSCGSIKDKQIKQEEDITDKEKGMCRLLLTTGKYVRECGSLLWDMSQINMAGKSKDLLYITFFDLQQEYIKVLKKTDT